MAASSTVARPLTIHRDIYLSLLHKCKTRGDIEPGKRIHAAMIKSGCFRDIFMKNHFINMYARCGSIPFSRKVFDEMSERNVFSWNNLLSGYAKFGDIEEAKRVFDEIPRRDSVAWNAIIGGYARYGLKEEAMSHFVRMLRDGTVPDPVSITLVFGISSGCLQGRQVHGLSIKSGLNSDFVVGGSLMDLYAKLGLIEDAEQVFEEMPYKNVVIYNTMLTGYLKFNRVSLAWKLFDRMDEKNLVSWTAMIRGLVQAGLSRKALNVFADMRREGLPSDSFVLASALNACAEGLSLCQGMQVQNLAIHQGHDSQIFVGAAIVKMYAKCMKIDEAIKAFENTTTKSPVSWAAMILGFVQNGYGEDSLKLYIEMLRSGTRPDEFVAAPVLSVCAQLAVLHDGMQVHSQIIVFGLDSLVSIGNSLVTMYCKCGSIDDAYSVFKNIHDKDEISWTAMIASYAQYGYGAEALECFKKMLLAGMRPDGVTFMAVFPACSRAGLLNEGLHYFDLMRKEYNIEPTSSHYACIIDLLGRAGRLDDAEKLINGMPVEDVGAIVWSNLLGACRRSGNVPLGERAAERLFQLEPDDPFAYVLLSNLYASANMWEDVSRVRKLMKAKGVKKKPGCSWLNFRNTVHCFVADDRSHPQAEEIYDKIKELAGRMEEEGYVPNMEFALHNVDDTEKQILFSYHSERLAIAFGLINVPLGSPIRIFKNLRVCGDCHAVTKILSKIESREIIVRDASHFHHFVNGACSCGDYW